MERVVHIEVGEDGVALITLNKPPVNSLDNSGSESDQLVSLRTEASRALALLLSDVNTAESVLGRPHALPYLLHSAASIHVNDAVEVHLRFFLMQVQLQSLMKDLEIKMVMTEASCKDFESECLEE